ncbi:unnamed protein product, partial [Durusdinium trenchii]
VAAKRIQTEDLPTPAGMPFKDEVIELTEDGRRCRQTLRAHKKPQSCLFDLKKLEDG